MPRKMYSLNRPTFAVNACSGDGAADAGGGAADAGGGAAGAGGVCAVAVGPNAAVSASAVMQVAQFDLIVGSLSFAERAYRTPLCTRCAGNENTSRMNDLGRSRSP